MNLKPRGLKTSTNLRAISGVSALGFRQFRVRYHENLVRLELAPDELPRALTPEMARKFVEVFKPLGFKFITLDLEGYRTGSFNPPLVKIQS
jgi:uncharacterized protein